MAEEDDAIAGEAEDTGTDAQAGTDVAEFDRDALADKIGDHPFFTDEDDADDTGEEETTDDTQEAEPEESEDEGGETDQEDQQELVDSSDTDGPTLPDAYRRSLKAYGWEDEDIDSNLDALGLEKFMPMAERIHDSRNKQIAEWAELGRAETTDTNTQSAGGDPATDTGEINTLAAIDPDDLVKMLGSEYGEDEAIVQVIKKITAPVNATIAALNSVIPDLEAGREAAQQSQEQQLLDQVNDFFSSDSMKPYAELYGEDWDSATKEQVDARWEVVKYADRLSAGAAKQGRQLSVTDALADANSITAADFTAKAAVGGIKKKAKERSRGLVQRPGGKAKRLDTSKPPSDADDRKDWAARRAGQRLKELFPES